jgi:glutathione S-transferase
VPALVHDGRTIIDSNDIIRYLDREFPQPSLAPTAREGEDLMALADASQLALRTVSHELMLGDIRRLDEATLDAFERDHGNREFFQFLRRFSTEGFDDAHLTACFEALGVALTNLEKRLSHQDWLASQAFSLVDISWVVNVHRLIRIDYPLQRYPHVFAWFAKISARPSYARALLAQETQRPVSRAIQERREKLYARL